MSYYSIFRSGLFEGQTIVVTGGSGIGRTVAHELASLRAHVVLAARNLEKLGKVRDEITGAGGSASVHVCNIRLEEQVVALFDSVLTERGAVHGLVNNAGGQFLSPAEHISLKGWCTRQCRRPRTDRVKRPRPLRRDHAALYRTLSTGHSDEAHGH